MTTGLPARGDIIRYNGDTGLSVEVLTDPVVDPPETLSPSMRDTTCWTIQVRYLNDHPTGQRGYESSWGIRADELHLYAKVGVTS